MLRRHGLYRKSAPILLSCFLLFIASEGFGRPVADREARKAVRGWLRRESRPFRRDLGKIGRVETCRDENGRMLFYVVHLEPEGFVVISPDDELEPVIAFSDQGVLDPYDDGPLSMLLRRDLKARLKHLNSEKSRPIQRGKWRQLTRLSETSEPIMQSAASGVSDLRVAPLVQSRWNQGSVAGQYCYNYYTPNHFVCGCVATAMAQLMRYHQYPTAGIGVRSYTVFVDGNPRSAITRGGDGAGGPYAWSQMPLVPNSSMTAVQRQAIGALCYDAGAAVSMDYASSGSGAYISDAQEALTDLFQFSNAVYGTGVYNRTARQYESIAPDLLNRMVNPGLDAGLPSLLGIIEAGTYSGHAIVVDGYGYNAGDLYHHLNMGWSGSLDAWYALPAIGTSYDFDTVSQCVYNIQPTGSGEIISGRILDEQGMPLEGASVAAYYGQAIVARDTTDAAGVYGLAGLTSGRTYFVKPADPWYEFTGRNVAVASSYRSSGGTSYCGNVWQADFTGEAVAPTPPTAYDVQVLIGSAADAVITLSANDDGQPGTAGGLTWQIDSLPTYGRLFDPAGGQITAVPYVLAGGANQVVYRPCGYYLAGSDKFRFSADDGGTAPEGGLSNSARVSLTVEYYPSADELGADVTLDCRVDADDLEQLISAWLSQEGDFDFCEACDVSQAADGRIDLADFAVLAQQWMRDGL